MHFHFTHGEILLGGFLLSIAVVFAIAASVRFFENRRPPFLNYFDTPYGRTLLNTSSNREIESRFFDPRHVLEPLRARTRDHDDWRSEITGKATRHRP